jgi:hypothetical protein
MKILKWIFFIFLTFLVQTQLSFFITPLNLSIVVVYFFGLTSLPRQSTAAWSDKYFGSRAEIKSTAFGASVGLLEDILSGTIVGPGFFSKGLAGFFSVVVFTDVVFKWTPLIGAAAMTILTILDGAIIAVLRLFFSDISINIFEIFYSILIQAVINIPFGIILKPREL